MCHVTSDRLWQNLNVLFFQCALTAQMAQKFKSSEPVAGHVKCKIGHLYFTVVKSKVKISQNLVAFSEYVNFNNYCLQILKLD